MKKVFAVLLTLALLAGSLAGLADELEIVIEEMGEETVEAPKLEMELEELPDDEITDISLDEAPISLDTGDILDLSLDGTDDPEAEAIDAEPGANGAPVSNGIVDIGDYRYSFDNGIATITAYIGSATSIVLPEEVVYNDFIYKINQVGDFAFADNIRLESVTLSANLMRLGRGAFKNCTGLRELVVNSDLAEFSKFNINPPRGWDPDYDYAPFLNTGTNTDSFTVTFGDGVTRVPAYMFATGRASTDPAYAHVTDVVIGANVKSIDAYAFFNCHDLRSVRWGQSLVSVGAWAFAYNTRLESIAIPAGTETIGERAFIGCNSLSDIALPDSLNTIGTAAFENCGSLWKVVLPTGLKRLGNIAFKNCTRLRELTVNSDLADFSKFNINPPKGWDPDYDYAPFLNTGTNADSFTVTFGDGVTRVPAYMFATGRASTDPAYAHVTDVVIGANVKSIDAYAFFNCHDLRSVRWGQSLVSVGAWAFAYNTRLESIAIPAGTETIGERAFIGCSSLRDIALPDSLSTIGTAAFENCGSLWKVVLPAGLKRLGNIAFKNCTGLRELVVTSDLAGFSKFNINPPRGWDPDYDYAPFLNTGTSAPSFTVTFAHGVTRIPAYMFATGRSNTEPEYCRVSTVYIPTTVTAVDIGAFCNCHELQNVIYAGSHYAWNAVTVGEYNGWLLKATFTYKQPDPVFATGVKLDKTTLSLVKGKKATLKATVVPENTTDKGVNWTSSDANVATVSKGVVTATGVGVATITATSMSNPEVSATCKVKVSAPTVAVKSVKLSKTKLTMNTGRIITLKATVKPANATQKGIKWQSSNTKVAMVYKGTVYAMGKGKATIRAISTSNTKKYASCKVTVKQANPGKRLTKVGSNGMVKVKKGKKLQLISVFAAKKGWQLKGFASSNKKVASVSATGIVTARKPGNAVITVTTKNGKKATVKIKVI